MQERPEAAPRDPKIVAHIQALNEAGRDLDCFAERLRAVRDDSELSTGQREAIFKTLAQDAARAYMILVRGG